MFVDMMAQDTSQDCRICTTHLLQRELCHGIGKDMLPVLSTYLGHTSINTAVYVSMTNELLKEAGRKFESCVLKL